MPEEKEIVMIVKNIKPPIWDEAHKYFDIDDRLTIFTYGEVIYNPGNVRMRDEYFEHEGVHAKQQMEYNGGPEAWWKRYFVDKQFRYDQELPAYGRQYAYYCRIEKDRNKQARYLHIITGFLASDQYKVGLTAGEIKLAIKRKANEY